MNEFMKANKKIETGVVGGYNKIEDSFVGGYKKIEKKFVDAFLMNEDDLNEKEGKPLQ